MQFARLAAENSKVESEFVEHFWQEWALHVPFVIVKINCALGSRMCQNYKRRWDLGCGLMVTMNHLCGIYEESYVSKGNVNFSIRI